jgi:prevent-host-death family protein
MKEIGLFEVKTKFSAICEEVAETGQPVTVTRRGRPLVRIDPITAAPMTIKERRAAYLAKHGGQEPDDTTDFEPGVRSKEISEYRIEG